MPTGPPLITLAELAAALELEESDLNAPRAEQLIALASDLIRDELDQRIDFVADDEVDVFGSGTDVLLLPELPVVDVTAVVIVAEGSSSEVALEAGTEYRAELGHDGRTGIIRRLGGRWPRRRIIRVTNSHGYHLAESGADSEVPGAIRNAVTRSCVRGYLIPEGVRQETIGRYSVTYASAAEAGLFLSLTDLKALDRYYKGGKAGAR